MTPAQDAVITKVVSTDVIAPYVKQAQAEHLLMQHMHKTLYIGAFFEHDLTQLIGFVGITISGRRAFFKNDYVLPQYRGRGYYNRLFVARLAMCRNLGIKVIFAYCTAMSLPIYKKYGAHAGATRGLSTYVKLQIPEA